MPRTKEQNMAIRAEKKQLIMDTALKLFAENGFERTSTESIAQHAGISSGLLFAYFKSKEDLLYQILASGMQVASEIFHADMTMDEFVEGVEKLFNNILENRDFFKLYSIISVQPKITDKIAQMRNESELLNIGLVNIFKKHFGEERAMKELLLISAIMKGFTIISVFADKQNVFPPETMNNMIMEFIREHFDSR